VDWLRAAYKYLMSFSKTDWQLEDYPVRVVSQTPSSDSAALPPYCAQIINSWLVGQGDNPTAALADLRKNLELARANGSLPRPGSRPKIWFASSDQIDRHGEFAYYFVEQIARVRPVFLSDETTLGDFFGDEEVEQAYRKIALLYGIDVREMTYEPLWRVIDAIHSKS